MNQLQQTQNGTTYEHAMLERLREQYLRRASFPGNEGKCLTVDDFYLLYRYIRADGYGKTILPYPDEQGNSVTRSAQSENRV